METKRKSNSIITTARDDRGNPTFTVLGVGTLTLHLDRIHADNRAYAEVHGWGQRIPDGAALARDTKTGKPATPREKYDAMARLVAHYESGTPDWSMVREGVGDTSLTIRAIAEVSGVTPREARERVERAAAAQSITVEKALATVRANSQPVRDAMDRMRGEGASADAGAILNALGV